MFLVGESLIHSLQQRMAKDMLHVVHQGVAPLAIASLITHHYTESNPGLTLADLDRFLKTEAWQHYKTWCRGKRQVVCPTSSIFSGQRFGRESWQTQPELSSCYKGAMVKYMIFWTADFLQQKLDDNPSDGTRLRAYCAYSLAQFQFLQETHGPWLSDEIAMQMHNMGRTFLLFYQKLAVTTKNAYPDKRFYKVVPKFHSLLHLCLFVVKTGRNPRYDHLYMEEDFMKHISKICARCHPSTMDTVALFRYRALIELSTRLYTWQKLGFRASRAGR